MGDGFRKGEGGGGEDHARLSRNIRSGHHTRMFKRALECILVITEEVSYSDTLVNSQKKSL